MNKINNMKGMKPSVFNLELLYNYEDEYDLCDKKGLHWYDIEAKILYLFSGGVGSVVI